MFYCRQEPNQKAGLHSLCTYMQDSYAKRNYNLALGTCVEIGTYLGESASIFSEFFYAVHTVDPWNLEFVSAIAGEKLTEEDLQYFYQEQVQKCPNIFQIRKPSLVACRDFPDNSIDCVYIDNWHHYSVVCMDIQAWLPKVRKGGFICGHDYHMKLNSQVIPAVKATLSYPDEVFEDFSWLKNIS